MNSSRKKEIAKRIAELEMNNVMSLATKEEIIMQIILEYKLGLGDMMELDDIIMEMLEK